jgi:hypothetical protein
MPAEADRFPAFDAVAIVRDSHIAAGMDGIAHKDRLHEAQPIAATGEGQQVHGTEASSSPLARGRASQLLI